MATIKQIIGFRVVRFLLVGLSNTTINFTVLNIAFYILHTGKLSASIIATSCAVIFSFALNRSFVFVDKVKPAQRFAAFVFVTAAGVLIIQNSVYALLLQLLHNHEMWAVSALHALTTIHVSADFVDINLSNLVASFIVMFWNYNGYKILVFKGKRHGNEIIEAES